MSSTCPHFTLGTRYSPIQHYQRVEEISLSDMWAPLNYTPSGFPSCLLLSLQEACCPLASDSELMALLGPGELLASEFYNPLH